MNVFTSTHSAAAAMHGTIIPIYSGACIELTQVVGGPFTEDGDIEDGEAVFVIIAEVAPAKFAIIARDNYRFKSGHSSKTVQTHFVEEIDGKVSMACHDNKLCVSLKPEDYSLWYQFNFEYEAEYWGFLAAITHVRNHQISRRQLIDDHVSRLRKDFLAYFKPKVPPYDDPKEIEEMRQREARLKEIVYESDTDSAADNDSVVRESRSPRRN